MGNYGSYNRTLHQWSKLPPTEIQAVFQLELLQMKLSLHLSVVLLWNKPQSCFYLNLFFTSDEIKLYFPFIEISLRAKHKTGCIVILYISVAS